MAQEQDQCGGPVQGRHGDGDQHDENSNPYLSILTVEIEDVLIIILDRGQVLPLLAF